MVRRQPALMTRFLASLLPLALALGGCVDPEVSEPGPGSGRLDRNMLDFNLLGTVEPTAVKTEPAVKFNLDSTRATAFLAHRPKNSPWEVVVRTENSRDISIRVFGPWSHQDKLPIDPSTVANRIALWGPGRIGITGQGSTDVRLDDAVANEEGDYLIQISASGAYSEVEVAAQLWLFGSTAMNPGPERYKTTSLVHATETVGSENKLPAMKYATAVEYCNELVYRIGLKSTRKVVAWRCVPSWTDTPLSSTRWEVKVQATLELPWTGPLPEQNPFVRAPHSALDSKHPQHAALLTCLDRIDAEFNRARDFFVTGSCDGLGSDGQVRGVFHNMPVPNSPNPPAARPAAALKTRAR
jgi:hypothetical protein